MGFAQVIPASVLVLLESARLIVELVLEAEQAWVSISCMSEPTT